ncbi:MAG: SUMF1/EgtB/PvdO family nonheme iron enzyme [Kiritimatiellae bacterium]|nr:SUMF1/EgtB/PvdO family nonheme iron enzyme [Kiritimatiellia bacterium]
MAGEPNNGGTGRTEAYRYRLPLGSTLAHFRILRPLGVGEFGEVYLAEDVETRKRSALRIIPEEIAGLPQTAAALRELVSLSEKLDHPNIRLIREMGTDQGLMYLAMDFIEGPRGEPRALRDEIRDGGGRIRDERKVRHVALQICAALEHAHRSGVVHGYLHPADILIGSLDAQRTVHRRLGSAAEAASDLDALEVHVSDFGIMPLREVLPVALKSDAYTSPEEKAGQVTPQTDFYAFGVILYQMLTGGRPGATFVPPSRYGVSKVWDPITERCLEPDPADRYPDAVALRRDVEKAVTNLGLRRMLIALVLLALAGVAAWQGYRVWQKVQAAIERRAEERRLAAERQAEAESLLAQARDLFSLRKIAQADVLTRRALDLVPGLPEALALQKELERAGDMAQAELARVDGAARLERLRSEGTEPAEKQALEKALAVFARAEALLAAPDYAAAKEAFREAVAECDHGLQLVENRQAALKSRKRAEQARWNAKRHSAERDAPELWANAEDRFSAAARSMESGVFLDAVKDWSAAIQVYGQAEQIGLAALRVRAEEARSVQAQEEERQMRLRWPGLPDGYRVIGQETDAASGLPKIIEHKKTGYRLLLIPAGPFSLGSPAGVGAAEEHPARRIELGDYWIGESEVTVEQYTGFLVENGNQTEAGVTWVNMGPAIKLSMVDGQFMPDPGFEEHPVVEVSWYGARAFAEWIGGDLPTEAQWEKAAEGGRETLWPWGDTWDWTRANTAERLGGRAEFKSFEEWLAWWEPYQRDILAKRKGAYAETTRPVRRFEPNGYGLFDMAGNVLEWCLDYYLPDAYRNLQDGQQDPPPVPQGSPEKVTYWRGGEKFEETAECRVVRGGSWGYMGQYARCAFRFKALSTGRYSDGGFRVVVRLRTAP